MTVNELLQEIAQHLGDPRMERLDVDRLIFFLNSAARDAANQGWYILEEEDESITLSANTYDYNVPANFAYIHELWIEDTSQSGVFTEFVPYHHWALVLDGGVPKIRFDKNLAHLPTGKRVKVVGQRRPTTNYSVGATSIDTGMESFLRERSVAYAARFLAGGGPELQQWYSQLAAQSFAISQEMLSSHPQQFRLRSNARYVPTR